MTIKYMPSIIFDIFCVFDIIIYKSFVTNDYEKIANSTSSTQSSVVKG